MRISPADHDRIRRAVEEAEQATSGEIFCVIARRVSSYREVGLAWAAAAAMILPLLLIPLGFSPAWLPGFSDGWQAAQLAATPVTMAQTLGAYALIQVVIFLVVFLIHGLPIVRRLMTPASIRRHRVRKAAIQQFLAHGIHVTANRTGVLIFCALDEHRVEVVADQGIHSRVPAEVWADVASALTRELRAGRPIEGFEAAIALSGEALSAHFPPGPDNPNELSDRLVEL
jgi:putative membrane protein